MPAIVLALLAPGCGNPPAHPATARRVVIIGVDGATWSLISPLMAAGRMPHLADLYRSGSAGALRSIGSPGGEPLDPAALWTSLATGRPPGVHGITESAEKIPGRYALRPITADRRRVPALWTIAGSRGVGVGVAGWPDTFPAERVAGFMIAEGYDPAVTGELGYLHPPGALGSAGGAGEDLPLSEAARKIAALDEELAESFRRDLSALSRGVALYRVYQPGLAFLRFESVDRASHRFWQYHERKYLQVEASRGHAPVPAVGATLAEAIPGAYAFLDEWIGMLLARLPERTTVLVVSTHGFRGVRMIDYIHLDLDRVLELLGLMARGPGGRPDWRGTRMFGMDGSASNRRALFVNVEGREAQGTVPAPDVDLLTAETARRLRELRSDRGEPLVRRVGVVDHPGPSEPDLELIENLGLDPSTSITIGSERQPVTTLYRRFSEDFGAHDATGILLAAGEGIAPGRTGWSADIYDVAPTVLFLLGLDLAADMPGSPIEEILAAPPGRGYPSVPSYDGLGGGPDPVHRPEQVVAREIERLRSVSHLR
ncbi:MAG TPA: alkaline phosphatase family protein [Candidatus Polarisedimenticolia bacterium]